MPSYLAGLRRYERVFSLPELIPGKSFSTQGNVETPTPDGKWRNNGDLILIWSPAIPHGPGVQLASTVRRGRIVVSAPKIVYAQPKCTGS